MATDELASGPLTGLRAIEFGQLLAGPYVGTLLADFGADVVKVEAPPAGDPMREWGQLRHNDRSLWWSVLSRNKRSVALNLREPRGQQIAAELCAGADVIVENFRPGTMERWGIGQSGSYRDRAGFAAGGEAISGLRYINGYPDQAPPRSGISLGDTLAAQSAFQGILLALIARANGAEGQVVDASIVDACFAMSESSTLEFEQTGTVRQPTGPRLPRIAPSNVYRSKDEKWVVIAANHDTLWRRLAKIMGRPELGEDERFATHHARGEHEDLLDEIIGAFAGRHTAEELDEIINGGGVVCAPVYTAEDVYRDPHFRERELLVETKDEVHGSVTVPGIVPKLSRTPGSIPQAARRPVGD